MTFVYAIMALLGAWLSGLMSVKGWSIVLGCTLAWIPVGTARKAYLCRLSWRATTIIFGLIMNWVINLQAEVRTSKGPKRYLLLAADFVAWHDLFVYLQEAFVRICKRLRERELGTL